MSLFSCTHKLCFGSKSVSKFFVICLFVSVCFLFFTRYQSAACTHKRGYIFHNTTLSWRAKTFGQFPLKSAHARNKKTFPNVYETIFYSVTPGEKINLRNFDEQIITRLLEKCFSFSYFSTLNNSQLSRDSQSRITT